MNHPRVANIVLNNFTNDNRVYKTSRTLRDAGMDVKIVALLKGDVPELDEADGIPVHRIRIRSMALPTGLIWGGVKYVEIIARIIIGYRKADIWHCNDFEVFFIGILAKMVRPRLKLVYDSHEYQAERYGKHPKERSFIRRMERWFIHRVEAFITVSIVISEEYKRLYNVENPVVVYNSPHRVEVESNRLLRNEFNVPDDALLFLYQGGLSASRGIEVLLETFERMNDSKLHLVLMGSGIHEDLCAAAAKRCESIHLRPPVPYHELIQYTAGADIGVISTQNLCLNNWFCMPNKMFEYIQAGVPVLCNDLYDCRRVIKEYGLGEIIPEYTSSALEIIVKSMATMDLNKYQGGLKRAKEHFVWESEEPKLLKIYQRIQSSANGRS
jgi:glycosyltransferase involved in cell wall biosynthesis